MNDMYKIIGGDLKEYGPVSAEDLRRWIAEGRVTGQTQVLAADGAEWKPLSSFPEFADSLPERGTFSGQPSATVGALAALPADVLTRDYDLNIGACVRP